MHLVLKIFGNIFYTAVVVVVVSVALLFLGTKVDLLGYQVKVVKSGSMEPAIHTGSIIVILPQSEYVKGDVITFGKDTARSIPVTHRIFEERTNDAGAREFLTKGDANEVIDPDPVSAKEIIGKMLFTIPYLGYVIELARTPLGFFFLIGVPALLIVLDECANIVWEIRKYRARKSREMRKNRDRVRVNAGDVDTPSRERAPFRKAKQNQKQFI